MPIAYCNAAFIYTVDATGQVLLMIRVVYAEDEAPMALLVEKLLQIRAPECVLEVVTTGQACLARMLKGGVDVLMLDLVLPDINGLQIVSELSVRNDATPIIMVSGFGQTELAVRALRAGAVDCIDKTTDLFDQLPDVIKRVHIQNTKKSARRPAGPTAARTYNIVLLEENSGIRDSIAKFFKENAPRLNVSIAPSLGDLERQILKNASPFDALIIGPNASADGTVAAMRKVRSYVADLPAIIVSSRTDGESAVAAFKLGARDYIYLKEGYLLEVVFSINNILKSGEIERRNGQLTRELEELNRTLEAQVEKRTKQLQEEVKVRQQAEHQSAEQAARLKELSKRLMKIQEDERRSIARELHDQVGQMLTGLKFQLEAAVASAPSGEKEKLTECFALASELMTHVRQLTQQFRPRILDDLGLKPALEWHVSTYTRQTNINVELELSLPAARLPTELETAIFRVVMEALTNIARHAGVATASVTVVHSEGQVQLEVTDRGKGFDLQAALASRQSIGLIGLAERVDLAGGRVDIFSNIGQGTRIHAEFPLLAGSVPSSHDYSSTK